MNTGVAGFLWSRALPRLPRLALAALLSCGCIASGTALLAIAGYLIQQASTQPPILSLTVATTAVRLFSLLRASSRYVERLASHDAVLRLLEDTRVAVFEAIEPRAPGAFDFDRSGDLMRRISGDVDALQDFYARSLLPPFVALVVIVTSAVIASLASAQMGITIGLVMTVLAVAIIMTAGLTARGAAAQIAELSGELVAEVTDALQGCADLFGLSAIEDRLRRIEQFDMEVRRASERLGWSRALITGLVSFATGATVLAVLIASVSAVQAGALPAIAVGIVALAAMAVTEPFALLPAAVDAARTGAASGRRLLDIIDRPLPVAKPTEPCPLPADTTIELRDLSMRYQPDAPPALEHLSLRLAAGQRIGIVGPSGTGKSTLASVLVRFRDFDGGTFTLGGADVRQLSEADVRTRIGLVAQDAYVFATSIRENLRLASPDASDDQLRQAARRVQLLEWIDSLPEGWDTRVGEHGAHISGGQRRRLALARALLADFPVLIVDEPTEALDGPTATAVMSDLLDATRERALLVISHRENDVGEMERVYLNGHIVATHFHPAEATKLAEPQIG